MKKTMVLVFSALLVAGMASSTLAEEVDMVDTGEAETWAMEEETEMMDYNEEMMDNSYENGMDMMEDAQDDMGVEEDSHMDQTGN